MLTIEEISAATDGKLHQQFGLGRFKGVSIDTRTIKPNEIFVAVKGDRFDGHKFIKQAVKNKAGAIIVSRPVRLTKNITVICVKDTVKALGQIAHHHRMKFQIPVIAITGSVGKTTAKDITAAVLRRKYNVLSTAGTQNNHFGVPLTLLKLSKRYQAAVIELGTNSPGEIEVLTQIAYPTIAVLTNIGHSHLKELKTLGGIFCEKAKIIKHMDPEGDVVFNNDDKFLKTIKKKKTSQNCVSYSVKCLSDTQALNIHMIDKNRLAFDIGRDRYVIRSLARHNVYNALAAIGVGRLLRVSKSDTASALRGFKFVQGRMHVNRAGGLWIIDDTYNANPMSVKGAIETLAGFPVKGRRIFVCADMLELGKQEVELHKDIGRLLSKGSIDVVLSLGSLSKNITDTLNVKNKSITACHFQSMQDLYKKLAVICRRGDAVLIKGSRAMKMERSVQFLKNQFSRRKN